MEDMVNDFWQGRKVFLTGHTGFKGSWLALWLQQLGADVAGYALPPHTTPNLFTIADVAQGMTSVVGDLSDFSHLKNTLVGHRPEMVLHLAAQSLVRASYQNPIAHLRNERARHGTAAGSGAVMRLRPRRGHRHHG